MVRDRRQIRIHLNLSAAHMMAYYNGEASNVHTRSVDGRTVRFPARVLRPFITRDGVQGEFVLTYDAAGRFVDLRKADVSMQQRKEGGADG